MALSQRNFEYTTSQDLNKLENLGIKLKEFIQSKIENYNKNKVSSELERLIKVSILTATSNMDNLGRLRFILNCRKKIDEIEDYILISNLSQENINDIDKNLRLLDITLMRVASYSPLPADNIKK